MLNIFKVGTLILFMSAFSLAQAGNTFIDNGESHQPANPGPGLFKLSVRSALAQYTRQCVGIGCDYLIVDQLNSLNDLFKTMQRITFKYDKNFGGQPGAETAKKMAKAICAYSIQSYNVRLLNSLIQTENDILYFLERVQILGFAGKQKAFTCKKS